MKSALLFLFKLPFRILALLQIPAHPTTHSAKN